MRHQNCLDERLFPFNCDIKLIEMKSYFHFIVTSKWSRWTVTSYALMHQNGRDEWLLPIHCNINMVEMHYYFICICNIKMVEIRWTVTSFAYVTSKWFRWTVTSFALQHQNGWDEHWLPLHCSIKMVVMNCYFLCIVVVEVNSYFPCSVTSK